MSELSPTLKAATGVPSHFPAPAFDRQGVVFANAFAILHQALADRVFPAASVAVTEKGNLVCRKAFGRFTYDANAPEATTESIFDLASVTKVVATTSMAMILYERGLLDLDTPLVAIVPEFGGEDARRREITLRILLAHSSGLPAYEKLFLRARTKAELFAAVCGAPLSANPGVKAEYSDLGFILLAAALERIAEEPMDQFCQREIFGPLGMTHTAFNPPKSWRASIPPTVDDRGFRRRIIQGEVQDENASVLGGVAGHAGLFASASDLAVFANVMLHGGRPILRSETLALFTQRQSAPPGTSHTLGWDTPSPLSQSGKYFSPRSFGHLGYTGTSLWVDPERRLSIVLLTNRTWPDCANPAIKRVRPRFHDAVVEALEKCQ